ncbi:hypothetical protein [uncultured Roseibium sp.]|uniref:hypothetical protein n=1 Tax=uncultured Roseibium sp. TaxID=1936171 RepID=UPI002614A9E7|nr:hypothetical protein [uncultured Roseibium sp.]
MFGHRVDDDIKEKISALKERQKANIPVEELFLLLAEKGYNEDVLVPLAALPISEYVRVLKYHKGDDFELMRRGFTQYNNLANPNPNHIEIMRKANNALQQIAKESLANELRVKRWGIAERLAKLQLPTAADAAVGDPDLKMDK